ncbi:quinic acid utilization activator [Stemphylium lycopersici]|uniref:Quinic acid utilization activator n=1 Tax=Stemphylium lycopersici TaxID=183478 RepID=A0A364N9L9_STELY|nr:quinic acid utilization activator [Stemphylium lycopersici]RAQ99528.1 quinic acid utilization activator [Stemphylium lycopersici]RAR13972.1 quinic acid utilization activator [Stemphylium lycopersici]
MESVVYNQLTQENTVLLARGTKDSNRLYKSWTKSRYCRDITKVLAGEHIGVEEDGPPSSDGDSEIDTEDATLLQTTPKTQSRQSTSWASGPSHAPQETAGPSLSELRSPDMQQPGPRSVLTPLPADCWKLFETYCTYTQCWLPIANKLEILKLSYSYPEQGLELSADMPNSGSHAEMWSIFALGSIQHESSPAQNDVRDESSQRLYDVARLLVPNELGKFHLDHADLAWMGRIEEDGMEEWQPWSGHLNLAPARQQSSPTLSLSTFNALLELVDILGSTARPPSAPNFLHEMIGRLEVWKSSLPQKLDYIRKDSNSTPMTPPALLLRLIYSVTALALVPSQSWLEQTLDVLSTLQGQLGPARMPAVVVCLLKSIERSSSSLHLDQTVHRRMCKLFVDLDQSSGKTKDAAANAQAISDSRKGTSPNVPNMLQASPTSFVQQIGGPFVERYHRASDASTTLNSLLPNMNNTQPGHSQQPFNPFEYNMSGPVFDPQDPYQALISGDLGSFLDDFASEHGAKKLQNQPQFMENLGFSSEVSMADLLAADPGRFLPTASHFGPENNEESPQFPLSTFYEAS